MDHTRITEALAALREVRGQVEAEIASLQETVEHLRAAEASLLAREGFVVTHSGVAETTSFKVAPSAGTVEEWRRLPRTDAIVRVLSSFDRPASPKEVHRHLHAVGRDDSGAAISAALSYLSAENRVKSLGRGQWVLPTINGSSSPSNQDGGGETSEGEDLPGSQPVSQ